MDRTLLYPNYFTMAENHLKACEILLRQCDNNTPFKVFHEIYYLCGYILEGLCIYAIFKKYDYYDEKLPINESYNDKDFTKKTNLHYKYFNNPNMYSISGHKFQRYVELLHCFLIFKDIEFFGPREISDRDVKLLVDNWDPKIRYDFSELTYCTYDSIKKLLKFCNCVYRRIYNQLIDED